MLVSSASDQSDLRTVVHLCNVLRQLVVSEDTTAAIGDYLGGDLRGLIELLPYLDDVFQLGLILFKVWFAASVAGGRASQRRHVCMLGDACGAVLTC